MNLVEGGYGIEIKLFSFIFIITTVTRKHMKEATDVCL